MKFGKVIGTVVSTQKDANLVGVTLLVIQPLDQDLTPKGSPYIAADATGQAGPGQVVTIVFSADATQAFPQRRIPVDASIVGIVDDCTLAQLSQGAG